MMFFSRLNGCVLTFLVVFFVSKAWSGDASSVKENAKPLTLITYNVWANKRKADARIPALLKILQKSRADIIALQEVTPWFLRRLHREAWVKPYHVRRVKGQPQAVGGLYLLSRYPGESFEAINLPSGQGRRGLVATLKIAGQRVRVATCHLDSFLEDGATRAAQLKKIFLYLKKADTAILLGDFNFGDGEQPETAQLPAAYVDAWWAIHAGVDASRKKPGYTWDIERSAVAKAGSFPKENSRRLDRILVRSTQWKPASITIVGNGKVNTKADSTVFPSDHFGVQATFAVKTVAIK